MRTTRPVYSASPRVYLLVLQLTFLVFYCSHLQVGSVTRLQGGLTIGLATLTLILGTIPKALLAESWFTAFLTLCDFGVLLVSAHELPSSLSWIRFALILILAMASYARSLPEIAILSSLVVFGYGFSLYQLRRMDADALLIFPVLLCLTLVLLAKARIVHAEVERIAETEEQTRNETMIDALTGLPNRAQFLEQVTRSIQCGRRNRDFHFAVLFLDLDGFKPINDKLGHKAGDAVLRQTAKRLQMCLRKGDLVGRYGGDEFTLLINNVTGPQDPIRVAKRVLAKLQDSINVGEEVKVGASIGIALSTNLHERAEDLIRDADGAMYRAKTQGKNGFVVSDPSTDIPAVERKERWRRVMRSAW